MRPGDRVRRNTLSQKGNYYTRLSTAVYKVLKSFQVSTYKSPMRRGDAVSLGSELVRTRTRFGRRMQGMETNQMHPRNGIITALKRFHSTFFLPMNEWLENMEAPRRDMVVRCLTAGSFKVPPVPQQQCASKEANLNDAPWSLCYCYTLAWLSDSCRMRHISNTPQLKIQKRIQSKEETVGKTINLSLYFLGAASWILADTLICSDIFLKGGT